MKTTALWNSSDIQEDSTMGIEAVLAMRVGVI